MRIFKLFIFIGLALLFSSSVFSQQTQFEIIILQLDSCRHNSNKSCEIDLLQKLAHYYQSTGNYNKSDSVLSIVLLISKNTNDWKNIINAINMLATNANIYGDLDKSYDLYKEALLLSTENHDSVSMANMCENISYTLKDAGNYREAMEYVFWAIEIRQAMGSQNRIPVLYKNIATLYDLLGNYDKQGVYLKKANKLIQEGVTIDIRSEIVLYNALGNYYDNKNKLDSAKFFYEKVADYSRKNEWLIGLATGLGNLAMIFEKEGKIDSAIRIHLSTLALEQKMKNKKGELAELNSLSTLYLKTKTYDSALFYGQKALYEANQQGYTSQTKTANHNLSKIYEKTENADSALKYFKQYKILEDSLLKTEHQRFISELDTKYQTKEYENHIFSLQQENLLKTKQIQLIVLTSAGLLALSLLALFYVQLRRKHNQLINESLKHKLFQTQMNPHFIFNILGSIQAALYNNKNIKEATNHLSQFAMLTRNILESSRKEHISLQKEAETITSYLSLEQLRTNNHFDFTVNIDEDTDAEFVFIPPMMIQPFVENAVKHAFPLKSNNLIEIQITVKQDRCCAVIEDNGIGISNTNTEKNHQSQALDIFKQRFILLKKSVKLKDLTFEIIDLSTVSNKSGTRVTLELPIFES